MVDLYLSIGGPHTPMRAVLVATFLLLPLVSGLAMAHDANTFTIIVRESRHDPSEVEVALTDTLMYINVDSRENITHRIGLDLNDDGDFDDEGEFGSGILDDECDFENDSDCRITWNYNATVAGDFQLTDYSSDGQSRNIWLNVSHDDHTEHEHGVDDSHHDDEPAEDEERERSSQTDLQKGMLLLGMMLIGGAGLLIVSMVMGRQ